MYYCALSSLRIFCRTISIKIKVQTIWTSLFSRSRYCMSKLHKNDHTHTTARKDHSPTRKINTITRDIQQQKKTKKILQQIRQHFIGRHHIWWIPDKSASFGLSPRKKIRQKRFIDDLEEFPTNFYRHIFDEIWTKLIVKHTLRNSSV